MLTQIPKFYTMLTSHAIIGYTLQPEKESLVHSHHWIAG
jgi:hypothetical protein